MPGLEQDGGWQQAHNLERLADLESPHSSLQPLLALGVGFLQRHGIPAAHYTLGIANVVALLGLAATPVVLYTMLRCLSLPPGYAVLAALLGCG